MVRMIGTLLPLVDGARDTENPEVLGLVFLHMNELLVPNNKTPGLRNTGPYDTSPGLQGLASACPDSAIPYRTESHLEFSNRTLLKKLREDRWKIIKESNKA